MQHLGTHRTNRIALIAGLAVAGFCLAPRLSAQEPMAGVHPSYDLVDIRPADFQPQVTGMRLLPDGRLLILTHEPVYDKPVVPGNLYVVDGIGGTGASGVTVKRVASNIFCGTGLLVKDDAIYIAEKTRLIEILGLDNGEFAIDPARDEIPGKYRTIYTYGWDGNFHQYAFGPLYRKESDGKGYFYVALSTGWPENINKSRNRASLMKISELTHEAEILASGIRSPNGISFGPEGEIFAADNQGGWLPSSKLNNLRRGRFYGFKNSAGGVFDSASPSPPAIWMPHGLISASPADPTYLTQGPYAGQFLIGDVRFGGLQRCFLEKVQGEYQGAIFRFSGGFETAFNRIEAGPDGSLYLGGMGAEESGFWTWPGAKGPKYFALNRLRPNNRPTFDFLAIRSTGPQSLELEFTEPVAASAADPANYQINTWTYNPTSDYGGPAVGTQTCAIQSAALTGKGNGVSLGVQGLKTGPVGYVVHVRIKSIASKSGRPLWTNEAWYTLNHFGPSDPTSVAAGPSRDAEGKRSSAHDSPRAAQWDGVRLLGFKRAGESGLQDVRGRTLLP